MDNIKYNIKKERFTIMDVNTVSKTDALQFIIQIMVLQFQMMIKKEYLMFFIQQQRLKEGQGLDFIL